MSHFGIPNSPQSPDIGQKSDESIFDFRISVQSLINILSYINMKLRPVTKFRKRNRTMLKKIDDNVMSRNCDAIVIFSIFGQFGTIQKPDSRFIVNKT